MYRPVARWRPKTAARTRFGIQSRHRKACVPQLGTHYVDPGAEVVEASTQPPVAFVARVDRGKQLSRRLQAWAASRSRRRRA